MGLGHLAAAFGNSPPPHRMLHECFRLRDPKAFNKELLPALDVIMGAYTTPWRRFGYSQAPVVLHSSPDPHGASMLALRAEVLLSVGILWAAGKKLGTVVVSSFKDARALMDWRSSQQDHHSGRPLRIWPLDNLQHSCAIHQQQRAIQALPEGEQSCTTHLSVHSFMCQFLQYFD